MEFLTVLQGLLTPVIAGLGILIAYRQWRTARDKLRLDLFDKRVEVYEAINEFITKSQSRSADKDKVSQDYLDALGKARWLFEPDVLYFCRKKILKCASELQELREAREAMEDGPELPRNDSRIMAKRLELNKYRKEFEEICTPYMAIRMK